MKLPELKEHQKYVGLYVFDFGDHTGLGFTAQEVAELLESERYKDGKVYKIHKAYPDGKLELKGIPAKIFQLEAGLFFYSNDHATASVSDLAADVHVIDDRIRQVNCRRGHRDSHGCVEVRLYRATLHEGGRSDDNSGHRALDELDIAV